MAVTSVSMHYSKVNYSLEISYKASNNFFIGEEHNVNDVISMTDNEATKTTFLRTRPALHDAKDEAEAQKFVHVGLEDEWLLFLPRDAL